MVLMGWDRATLGRQPARVVRRLMHRVFASLAWDPEWVAEVRAPVPDGPIDKTFAARVAKEEDRERLARLERMLFPEDESRG